MVAPDTIYAAPRHIASATSCDFYHAMDIPGLGVTEHPQWDLRGTESAYLGGVELAGKRVLEIGPASGFLTFYMESQGAEVVSVELAPDMDWDIVPDSHVDLGEFVRVRRAGIERTRNAYWFAHERFASTAKVFYGDVYNLPEELGHFDIALMASVLLHVRDPLRVVENCARLSDTLVVTDPHYTDLADDVPIAAWFSAKGQPFPDIWWRFSPQLFVRFAEVMGFDYNAVTFHEQRTVDYEGPSRPAPMFTVVSSRFAGTTGAEAADAADVAGTPVADAVAPEEVAASAPARRRFGFKRR